MTPINRINTFFQAIIEKNVTAICSAYIPDEKTYVVLEGPRYTTLGYENIAKGWTDFCASALHLKSIEWIEGPFEETSADMSWVGGQMILTISINEKMFSVQFRGTFVLRKNEHEDWAIRHEHVSGPLTDPYGIGDWLKK